MGSSSIIIIDTVLLLLQTGIFSVFFIQSKKVDRNSEKLLIAIAFGIIGSALSLWREVGADGISRLLLMFQLMFYSLEYLYIYLHFNDSQEGAYNWKVLGPFLFVMGITMTESLVYGFSSLGRLEEFLWDESYNTLGVLTFTTATLHLYKSYQFTGEKEALIQSFGTALLVAGFVLSYFTTPIVREFLNIEKQNMVGDAIKIIGGLLFISIYAINPDFVERLTIETYGVLVFDKGGRELAFLDVRTKRKPGIKPLAGIETSLLSSLISALLSFLREAIGSKGYPRLISSADKEVLFEMHDEIGVALITDKCTNIMRRSLKKFAKELEKQAKASNKQLLEPFEQKQIISILLSKFPYFVNVT